MTKSLVEQIQNLEVEFSKSKERDDQYLEAIALFDSLVERGFIRPRGYCLSSIADYSLSSSAFISED